jgi:hypothetical protein
VGLIAADDVDAAYRWIKRLFKSAVQSRSWR